MTFIKTILWVVVNMAETLGDVLPLLHTWIRNVICLSKRTRYFSHKFNCKLFFFPTFMMGENKTNKLHVWKVFCAVELE